MEALPELQRVMNEFFLGNLGRAGEGLEVLPGVVDLLKRLQADERFYTCLVTGNLEPIGWGKMDALGIGGLFTQPRFGGFGSDYCSGNTAETWRDRAEFVRLADKKGQSAAGKASGVAREGWCGMIGGGASTLSLGNEQVEYTRLRQPFSTPNFRPGAAFAKRVHIGDAPMDVQAAADAGAVPLGVTTGIYTREQLEKAAPSAIILEGLQDLEQVLHVLEGST